MVAFVLAYVVAFVLTNVPIVIVFALSGGPA